MEERIGNERKDWEWKKRIGRKELGMKERLSQVWEWKKALGTEEEIGN